MDQRFPLHVSIPSQRAIAGLPPLETTSREPTDALPSPIPDTHNPGNLLSSQHASSPTALSISRTSSSSTGGSPTHHHSTTLPPAISDLEQPGPTHLTNPLPFQHEHRNQVPVEGEYPLPIPNQGAIAPAPPPYSRHVQQPKHDGEQPRPQLQLIDVSATVRALPTVPTAVGQDVYPSSASSPSSEVPITSGICPQGSISHQGSNTGLSMQSEQSTRSNVLLLQGSEAEKGGKHNSNRRLCGINLWWILLAIALILVLFSIILGVTYKMAKQQNQKSQSDKNGGPPPQQPPPPPPSFPKGAFPVSLKPVNQNRACLVNITNAPQNVSWACHLPQDTLYFHVEPTNTPGHSYPQPPPNSPPPDYFITSVNGSNSIIYEGVQPFNFSRQPLYFSEDNDGKHRKRDGGNGGNGGDCYYQFSVLYTKVIALRPSTIDLLHGQEQLNDQDLLNYQDQILGNKIKEKEPVWWCEWKDTNIQGKVSVEGGAVLMELSDTHNYISTMDSKKGEISCWEGMVVQGRFLPKPESQDSSEKFTKVQSNTQKRDMVEKTVRRRLRKRNVRRWGELPVYKRDSGQGVCSCLWSE